MVVVGNGGLNGSWQEAQGEAGPGAQGGVPRLKHEEFCDWLEWFLVVSLSLSIPCTQRHASPVVVAVIGIGTLRRTYERKL